jgi:hypothetical protein
MRNNLGWLTGLCLLVSCGTGQAATVNLGLDPTPWNTDTATTLVLSPAVPAGNQVQNLPCIICGANQPQQPALFGYNLFGNTGNADTVSFFSTAIVPPGPGSGLAIDQFAGATGYSIGANSPLLNALAGNLSFSIGLDVNDTNAAQTLESFWFLNLTTHTVLGVFSPGPGGTLVPAVNDGTGYPDYTITGLTLNGISQGDQIMFFARITGANDGPDSFFLMPSADVNAVPIPGAVWLFASGLAGLGALARRQRKKKQEQAAQAA